MRFLIPALFLLTACQTVPTVKVLCLPMVTYSPEQEAKAAEELKALPPGSVLGTLITDYGRMRAEDRACQATASPSS